MKLDCDKLNVDCLLTRNRLLEIIHHNSFMFLVNSSPENNEGMLQDLYYIVITLILLLRIRISHRIRIRRIASVV